METIDNRSFKEKAERFAYDCKEGMKRAGRWLINNPDALVGGIITVSTVIGAVAKASQNAKKAQAAFDESRRVWDPVMGVNLFTHRPMNGAEKLEFEARVKHGQSRAEALDIMGLLDKKKR